MWMTSESSDIHAAHFLQEVLVAIGGTRPDDALSGMWLRAWPGGAAAWSCHRPSPQPRAGRRSVGLAVGRAENGVHLRLAHADAVGELAQGPAVTPRAFAFRRTGRGERDEMRPDLTPVHERPPRSLMVAQARQAEFFVACAPAQHRLLGAADPRPDAGRRLAV